MKIDLIKLRWGKVVYFNNKDVLRTSLVNLNAMLILKSTRTHEKLR